MIRDDRAPAARRSGCSHVRVGDPVRLDYGVGAIGVIPTYAWVIHWKGRNNPLARCCSHVRVDDLDFPNLLSMREGGFYRAW